MLFLHGQLGHSLIRSFGDVPTVGFDFVSFIFIFTFFIIIHRMDDAQITATAE